MKILLLLISALFAQANDLYTKADYAQAASLYEQCLTDSTTQNLRPGSVALIYYNLGNAYFKAKQTPEAILWYERALRLDPSNEDIKHNIAFANFF